MCAFGHSLRACVASCLSAMALLLRGPVPASSSLTFGPGHGGQLGECLCADCTVFAAEQEMSTCCLFIFSAHLNVKLHNILFSFFFSAPDAADAAAAAAWHLYYSENCCVKILLVEHLKTAGRKREEQIHVCLLKMWNHRSVAEASEGRLLNCRCCL